MKHYTVLSDGFSYTARGELTDIWNNLIIEKGESKGQRHLQIAAAFMGDFDWGFTPIDEEMWGHPLRWSHMSIPATFIQEANFFRVTKIPTRPHILERQDMMAFGSNLIQHVQQDPQYLGQEINESEFIFWIQGNY